MSREYIITDVAIYLRKSRGESDKDLDKHRDALIEICKSNNWKYVTYEEIASGDNIEMRPKMQELLKDLKDEDDLYDAVLVIDQDRLSRGGTTDAEVIKEALVESNTLLIENGNVYDLSTDQDEFVYDMKSIIARQEYKQIKKRLRRGKIQGARKGLWTNGQPPLPYVYNKEKQILEVDETMLVTYRYIIDSVVNDKKATNQIMYDLNKRGMKTAGKNGKGLWTSKTVRDILLDMTHLEYEDTKQGHIVIGKTKGNAHLKKSSKAIKFEKIDKSDWKIYKGLHKSLKTQEEHELIELFLSRKTKAPRRPTSKKIYPLTGLLKCGSCGYYMGFTERTDRKGLLSVKKCWYINPYGVKCSNKSGPMNEVIDRVNEMIDEHIKGIEEEINNVDTKRIAEIETTIKNNQKILREKEEALERQYRAYESGVYELEEFKSRRIKLKDEMDSLIEDIRFLKIEQKYLHEQGNKERVDILKTFQEVMCNPNLTSEEQNELYKTIIEHITYTRVNEKIKIEITFK